MKGRDLRNTHYVPLYNFLPVEQDYAYVIEGEFVSTGEGTGIVHIAPAFGEDDLAAGRQYLQMDGKEVFRHAVVRMPESVRAVLAAAGTSLESLDLLIPHQANLRISEMVQKDLKLRDDQVYNNIQDYGNTTAATIPIALDECVRAGKVKPGDLIAFTAFGSGFMWGSVALRW